MTEEKAHSQLGASISERWLNCSGSVALSEKAPPPKQMPAALEGTNAHGFHERWLRAIHDGLDFKIPKELKKNTDMLKAVYKSVDFIANLWDASREELLIEKKVSLSHIDREMFGTADVIMLEHGEHLQVWDYKHGKGHAVNIVNKTDFTEILNTQLVYYALGAAHKFKYKFKKVTMGVTQPRAPHKDGWRRSKTVSMKELRSYEPLFQKGVARIRSGKTKLFVGPWCHFCPARDYNCPLQEKLKYEKAKEMFD